MHQELEQLLTAINAAEADAKSLVHGLTDIQGNWRPRDGAGWSVAQCLDHLSKINVFYVSHFLPAVEKASAEGRGPFRGLRPTWFGRRFIALLEPPVKQRGKAPKNVVPAAAIPIAEVLRAYLESHDSYRRMVEISDDVDVNRVVIRNPFIRAVRTRAATALLIVPAHDRRHLWQARRVLASTGFPK